MDDKEFAALIQRLKTDIEEESGTSPTFLNDLKAYMEEAEKLASMAYTLGSAFPDMCARYMGWELKSQAWKFIP